MKIHANINTTQAFREWVANTMTKLGGNPAQYLCGIQEECALTYGATRMNACQGVFDIYFHTENLDLTRVFVIVPTHNILMN